jgi:hypothetical protein
MVSIIEAVLLILSAIMLERVAFNAQFLWAVWRRACSHSQ